MSIGKIKTERDFVEVMDDGTVCTYKGVLHSSKYPSITRDNGDRWWYWNGQLHRDNDLPAYISNDGRQGWYQNGIQHRGDDKPTHVHPNGYMEWRVNGRLHRVNGPAVVDPIHGDSYYTYGCRQRLHTSDARGLCTSTEQSLDRTAYGA